MSTLNLRDILLHNHINTRSPILKKKEKTYLIHLKVLYKIRRNRPKHLGKDIAILLGSALPKGHSLVGKRISDESIFARVVVVVVWDGSGVHEGSDGIAGFAVLGWDEPKVL